MAWADHLNLHPDSCVAGLPSLGSRAVARWIALAAALSLILFTRWLYFSDWYPQIAGSPDTSLPSISPPGETQLPDVDPLAQNTGDGGPRPAWISTPATFNISMVPGYSMSAARPDGLSALPPSLAEAMARFLERPVLGHDQAVAQNEAACPREQLEKQVNGDQLRGDRDKWLAVDGAKIVEMRLSALNFLRTKSEKDGEGALIGPGLGPEGKKVQRGSRGVVIAAGNRRTVERAIGCIKETQKLGWKGGVEVWHFEGELQDNAERQSLTDLGVRIHMVSAKKAPGQWKNFELKAEAIRRSSFDEVLYLDSDNFPLSDVTAIFTAPLFVDPSGGQAIFWPDLNRDHPDNAIHRVLGIPCHDAWELDSGQILIAKSGNNGLNLAALYLAEFMQTEGGHWFSGGDKDTFRYAFLALGIPYTPAPRWLALLGSRLSEDTFCGAAMLQFGINPPRPKHADPADPTHPEPLFVHANLMKHMSGAARGDVFPQMRRLALTQDDVRLPYPDGQTRPLDSVVGGGREVPGRGLCSDIWIIGAGAEIETLDAKDTFGALLEGFEEEYFKYGGGPGAWK